MIIIGCYNSKGKWDMVYLYDVIVLLVVLGTIIFDEIELKWASQIYTLYVCLRFWVRGKIPIEWKDMNKVLVNKESGECNCGLLLLSLVYLGICLKLN